MNDKKPVPPALAQFALDKLTTKPPVKSLYVEVLRDEYDALRAQYQRDVYGLNNEGDPIGSYPPGGYANDNVSLRAELSALKAQPSAGVVLPELERWSVGWGGGSEVVEETHPAGEYVRWEDYKALRSSLNPCRAQSAQVQICKLGRLGAAYDGTQTRYAYTYTNQPDNVGAMKLGRAAAINATRNHGDEIDRGLHLLLQLQAEGFGVFQIAANHTEQHLDMAPGERQKESGDE